MQFENILSSVGGFGTYQKLLCFILIPATTGLCAFVYTAQLIILATPPYECSDDRSNTSVSLLATYFGLAALFKQI